MSRQQKTLTRRRLCLGVMIFAAVYVAILVHVAHIPHGIQQAPPPGLRQRAAVPEPPMAAPETPLITAPEPPPVTATEPPHAAPEPQIPAPEPPRANRSAAAAAAFADDAVHLVFSTDCSGYQHWQSIAFFYAARRAAASARHAHRVGLLRAERAAVAAGGADRPRPRAARAHFTPSYALARGSYKYSNKPGGLLHFFEHARVDERFVALLDPDMLLTRPLAPRSAAALGRALALGVGRARRADAARRRASRARSRCTADAAGVGRARAPRRSTLASAASGARGHERRAAVVARPIRRACAATARRAAHVRRRRGRALRGGARVLRARRRLAPARARVVGDDAARARAVPALARRDVRVHDGRREPLARVRAREPLHGLRPAHQQPDRGVGVGRRPRGRRRARGVRGRARARRRTARRDGDRDGGDDARAARAAALPAAPYCPPGGGHAFAKRKMRHDFFSCGGDPLELDADAIARALAPTANGEPDRVLVRSAFMLCHIIPMVNAALESYKRDVCGAG